MTWDQLKTTDSSQPMPDNSFFYLSIGYGLLALVIRSIFHCLVALPLVTLVSAIDLMDHLYQKCC